MMRVLREPTPPWGHVVFTCTPCGAHLALDASDTRKRKPRQGKDGRWSYYGLCAHCGAMGTLTEHEAGLSQAQRAGVASPADGQAEAPSREGVDATEVRILSASPGSE